MFLFSHEYWQVPSLWSSYVIPLFLSLFVFTKKKNHKKPIVGRVLDRSEDCVCATKSVGCSPSDALGH